MSKKHARIEQLDESEESDDPYVQNEIENYLATGEISCQNFIFNTVCEELFNVIKSSNLSVSEKKKELIKAVEAKRKSIEGRWDPLEYLRFPPCR